MLHQVCGPDDKQTACSLSGVWIDRDYAVISMYENGLNAP